MKKSEKSFLREEYNHELIKTRFAKSKGQAISLDYFLFTCMEEEKTILELGTSHISNFTSYPNLKETLKVSSSEDLQPALEKLCSWYVNTYPKLASSEPLDYILHAHIVYGFALFKIDLCALLKNSFANRIPAREIPVASSLNSFGIWWIK